MSDQPKHDPGESPPSELSDFYRIGPLLLVLGSLSVVATIFMIFDMLRWEASFVELPASAMRTFGTYSQLLITLLAIQGFLGLVLMTGRRRGRWRTWLVLSPAACLVAIGLINISPYLLPDEWHHRRLLGRHLGGPLPASVGKLRCHHLKARYPITQLQFDLRPSDYDRISAYRPYVSAPSDGSSKLPRMLPGTLQADVPGSPFIYYLHYDPGTKRCTFSLLNH